MLSVWALYCCVQCALYVLYNYCGYDVSNTCLTTASYYKCFYCPLLQAFNTFIDDVFAFIITMPTSHSWVAVFRDDVVFLVYLYQRWYVRPSCLYIVHARS